MIGRQEERRILRKALSSKTSEFIAVVGRRRVGKTYLIRQEYANEMAFEMTGIQNATMVEQLTNFRFSMGQYFPEAVEIPMPKNWIDAFAILIDYLSRQHKPVVFIDELPWLATARSGFLKGLSFFWNSWASKNNITLITCGSAASWMIQKLILNKGGLHNRVTRQIALAPFTLGETKAYLESRSIALSEYQITQLYMVIGGIPFYLKLVPKGKSIPQIIDYLLLSKSAPLKHEFENLYQSLFNNAERYITIIQACHSKWKGLSHQKLSKHSGLPSGGSLTRMVNELEVSGFIETTPMIGAIKKNTLHRVVDEFSIFYLHFIQSKKLGTWSSIAKSRSFQIWQGFAFENICLKHIDQIKNGLGISGVNTRIYSYLLKGGDEKSGTQIDLIIERDDQILNLCEIKFHNKVFAITKSISENLNHKTQALQSVIGRNQSIHQTLICTFGIKENKYSSQVQSEVVLKDLFEE